MLEEFSADQSDPPNYGDSPWRGRGRLNFARTVVCVLCALRWASLETERESWEANFVGNKIKSCVEVLLQSRFG